MRTFVFKDAKSHKFWSVLVDGDAVVTRWGRVGTDGQEKRKELGDPSEAEDAADKLVREKLRKGYVEQGNGASAAEAPAPAPAPAAERPAKKEPVVAKEPAVAEEPAPAPPPRERHREPLTLDPGEWAIATWRPLPGPPPEEPFDRARAEQSLKDVISDYWWWTWRGSPIGHRTLGVEEATFWLRVTTPHRRLTAQQALKQLGGDPEPLDEDGAFAAAVHSRLRNGDAMAALVALVEPASVVDFLLGDRPKNSGDPYESDEPREQLAEGIRRHLLPRLEARDRERLEAGALRLARAQLAADPGFTNGYEATLAAQLGLGDEVEAVVSRWPDEWFSDGGGGGYAGTLLGLPTAERVVEEAQRTRWRPTTPHAIAGWLAHTELGHLDLVAHAITRATSKEDALVLAEAFADRVHAAEAAPHFVALLTDSRAPGVAKRWLAGHVAEAAHGLAPLVGRQGKQADAAAEQLRRLARAGHDQVVREALGDKAAAFLDDPADDLPELTDRPGWLADAVPAKAPGPHWLEPAELPALVIAGARVGDDDVETILADLATSTLEEPGPLATGLAEDGDPEANDAFGWALFDSWLAGGAQSKDKWALIAVGLLGGDRSATRLAPLVRTWPGESQHQRAVLGLGCLRAIGTETALMQLSGIAQKVKFKGIQQKAREAMDAIAAERGMTREELEDRVVPDCGLDPQGRRTFDYGPRSFEFVLGPGMKPMLRDPGGKLKTSPPKPGAKDDAELAERSREEWKLMRKQVGDVAKIQAGRLEQAMVSGRRWSTGDFHRFLVGHPLQRHLVRQLVFAAWREGRMTDTFRLTEEGDLADSADEPFELAGDAEVSVVHPLQLDDAARAAWGELLADYEIVPPFAQLGRSIHQLEAGEEKLTDLERYRGLKIPPVTLVGILERTGWVRGPALDGGLFHLHTRPFHHANVTAVVEYEGIPVGYMIDWDDQEIEHCYVLAGTDHDPGWEWGHGRSAKGALRWGDVDPIVRSEVLGSLNAVAARARDE